MKKQKKHAKQNLSDTELIKNAQRDKEAFSALYLKYFKKIYTYLWLRVGKSKHIAQELAQETFLKAFKNISSFTLKSPTYVIYLFKIAHNVLVNYYRKAKTISLEQIERYTNLAENPRIEKDIDIKFALSYTSLLNPLYQKVILLKYKEGFSIKEIATKIQKSENAVKILLHRARKELKEYIEKTPQEV